MPDLQNPGHSPRPPGPAPTGMDFPVAIRAVIDGKRITRLEWGNKNDFGELKGGFLQIHTTKDGKFHTWTVSEGDLLAHDWVVCEDPKRGVN